MITSFLGVSLCLSDFLADGFNRSKQGREQILIYAATFLPPFIIVLINPKLFIVGLSYAGIFCAILLVLLPALMAWHGRYIQNLSDEFRVWGGKTMLVVLSIVSLLIIFHEVVIDFHLWI